MVQLYNIPHLKMEETFHILKVKNGYVLLTAKLPELSYIPEVSVLLTLWYSALKYTVKLKCIVGARGSPC